MSAEALEGLAATDESQALASDGKQAKSADPKAQLQPIAVVELFTSEGCSSCPPADSNLSELAERGDAPGSRIFPLSFHVDYWNYLGWSDPFSSEAYSERQRSYGRAWRSNRVYTPQMVVNGEREFVGSNRTHLERFVKQALAKPALVSVSLEARAKNSREITVRYDSAGTPNAGGYRLNLAAVQRFGAKDVESGENAGHRLAHRNIVRAFQTVPAAKSGHATLTLPADCTADKTMVVAYAQREDMVVLGAAAATPQL